MGRLRWAEQDARCCCKDLEGSTQEQEYVRNVLGPAADGAAETANPIARIAAINARHRAEEAVAAGANGTGVVLTGLLDPQLATCERRHQALLLRDLFGNPFQPIPVLGTWLTAQVVTIALAAYDERLLPSGHLNPLLLAVLADAIEETGCANTTILEHLRQSDPHYRGCWVLDAILGKN
jgi:hypothetical protein